MKVPFPLIRVEELGQLYQDQEDFILIDASAGAQAFNQYRAGHLHGALFMDLETQLAAVPQNAADGGRHPLPEPKIFANILSESGILPSHRIVVYDDKNGANAAARLWWMLKAIGHEQVQLLDGGLQAAKNYGIPISSSLPTPLPASVYPSRDWLLPIASFAEVQQVSTDDSYTIVDVRDQIRFDGITEPIDLIAGHIPNAVNIPFQSNLDNTGLFRTPEQLTAQYQTLLESKGAEQLIIHCGSGVTACHSLLAFAAAGLEIPKLYVGSWSEWSRNNLPMITKANN
ncbi:sulfurtransferase [Sphingobacterium spiritivorum]|uniref:sulfurtransferase n=1 Tax=Sphingobacterium spiritivorum TaxID=258 RepID=UPI003DA51114